LNHNDAEKPFLSEKTFRRALLLGTNRQWIIDEVLNGQGVIAPGPILPGTWAYLQSLRTAEYDPTGAEVLLDELGWEVPSGAVRGSPEYVRSKEENPLRFDLIHADNPTQSAVAEAIRDSWELIGIQLNLIPADGITILEAYLEPRKYEAALVNINLGNFPDPDPYPFWHDSQVEAGQNYSGFADRNIGIWLEKARTTPDLPARADLYKNFQYRFQDQLPALPLYSPVYSFAIDSQVQGVRIGTLYDPSDRFANIVEWHTLFRRPSASLINDPTS
jgi:peptide/nickel transport system substrate-binding protein